MDYSLKDYAKDYNETYGFNIVPMSIKSDGNKTNKKPLLNSFTEWFTNNQLASDVDNFKWNGITNGFAAICGVKDLRCFDFDLCNDKKLIEDFIKCLELPNDYQWITKTVHGYHIWLYSNYKFDKAKIDFNLTNINYKCGHVEYRHKNCLTVLPPSTYSGGKYKFINVDGIIPSYAPFKVSSKKIRGVIKYFFKNDSGGYQKKDRTANDQFSELWTKEITKGKRHSSILRLCGKYNSLGMPESLVLSQLLVLNGTNLKPNLMEREIENIVRDVYGRYETKKEINLLSARDIQTMELKPINWIIQDFLPEGLGILAGRPKIGKSFFALNISLAIAQGGIALGKFKANQHSVFYIPYEDHYRRLQDRISNILKVDGITEAPSNLFYPCDCEFPKLNHEGIAALQKILDENENIKLVVIDTLARAIKRSNKRSNEFQDEYDFVAALQKIAIQYHISILFIHHTTKAKYDDVFDQVLGTTGLTASPDLLMLLHKNSNKNFVLSITGRDIESKDFAMNFKNLLWEASEIETTRLTPEREEIANLFKVSQKSLSTGEISKELNKSVANVSKLLSKLVDDGIIIKEKFGTYSLL